MKTWNVALLVIALSLMCLFTCVGYAALSDTLTIQGEVEVTIPDAVFIAEISNVKTSNVTVIQEPVNIDAPSVKVLSEVTFNSKNTSITFDVLVVNGTQFTQIFNVLKGLDAPEGSTDTFSYGSITPSVSPGQGTEIKPGERQLFTVTLKYNPIWGSSSVTRKMLYEFDFVLDSDDLTQAVSVSLTDQFKKIINDDAAYSAITSQMETGNSGRYIGNVTGANQDDRNLLTELFEGTLTFQVGNEEVPVTVMIKEQNVWGTNVNELVLYFTADNLQYSWNSKTSAPVYAVVFSQNSEGEWVQIGDILAGEASICDYSTGWPGSGSFNTDNWESTQEYYGQAAGSALDSIMDAFGE